MHARAYVRWVESTGVRPHEKRKGEVNQWPMRVACRAEKTAQHSAGAVPPGVVASAPHVLIGSARNLVVPIPKQVCSHPHTYTQTRAHTETYQKKATWFSPDVAASTPAGPHVLIGSARNLVVPIPKHVCSHPHTYTQTHAHTETYQKKATWSALPASMWRSSAL